mgnify:CR=1 FL=1
MGFSTAISIGMESIIFYGDEILDLTNNKLRNQYLRQHIENTVNSVTHFTGEPQIDSSAFKYLVAVGLEIFKLSLKNSFFVYK